MGAELLDGMLASYPDRRHVRLEIDELSFVDGAGLRSIVAEHRRLLDRHGELVLTGVGPRVRRLLELTELDHVLRTSPAAPGGSGT